MKRNKWELSDIISVEALSKHELNRTLADLRTQESKFNQDSKRQENKEKFSKE